MPATWIPVTCCRNQGALEIKTAMHSSTARAVSGGGRAVYSGGAFRLMRILPCDVHRPAEWEQTAFFKTPDFYHWSPDSGDLQYKLAVSSSYSV